MANFNLNKVMLGGRLTADPELKTTANQIPVVSFSIAVNRRFRNAQTGQQETDFFNIVAWRQLAELCSRYLAKGRKVAVFGSIQTRSYEAQDGSKRTAFDIVADEVEFLSAANAAGGSSSDYHAAVSSPASAPRMQQAPAYAPMDSGFTQVDDDELPF